MSASQNLDQSDIQEEIKSLEAELRRAEETKNEARAIELHEEIGRIENQIKDQGQRIETVARVAAQAVTLVIWVATITARPRCTHRGHRPHFRRGSHLRSRHFIRLAIISKRCCQRFLYLARESICCG